MSSLEFGGMALPSNCQQSGLGYAVTTGVTVRFPGASQSQTAILNHGMTIEGSPAQGGLFAHWPF